jgi:hypothetical protein
MNPLKKGQEDFVSAWFNAGGIPCPDLTQRAFFEFSPGGLAVASNSEPFIKNISNRLRHYQTDAGEIKSTARKIIEAEIYYLDDPSVKEGIFLPPSLDGIPIDLDSPGNCRVFKTDSFYHLKPDHREGFWRPNDLLVSFSTGESKTIKILIAETSTAAVPLSGGRALRRKGTVNWEEISDMVHMLFMRLFDVFCLHAASLIVKDKGVILTGASGSGKTTSALALIQGGATLLSDELTLISTGSESVTISGIILDPRLSNIDGENIYSIDEPGTRKNNWEKVSFPLPHETAKQGLYKEVKPASILFMDLKENNPSRHMLHPVDDHEAVNALISQVLDPSNSTRHKEIFEAIFQLVTECSLYRLEPGRDIDRLPEFIAGLL